VGAPRPRLPAPCRDKSTHLAGKSFIITPFDVVVIVGGELTMKFDTVKGLFIVAALAASPLAWAQGKVVNIYNWAEYTAPDTISGFEKATGIKPRYDVYDSNDTLQAKLLTGKSGYDVVVPSTH